MGKVIALILIAIGAYVHAEEVIMMENLVDRASNKVVGEILVDMDDATLAKPAKASGAKKTVATRKSAPVARKSAPVSRSGAKRGARPPIPGTFTPINDPRSAPPKRLFGGTNRIEGNMAGKGMAIQEEGQAIPSYWGGKTSDKGIGYGWSIGGKKVNQEKKGAPVRTRAAPAKPKGAFTAFQKKDTTPKRLFGGRSGDSLILGRKEV